jgi:hypothetical protein
MTMAGALTTMAGWRFYSPALESALRETLAAVADIDCRFERTFEDLDRAPLAEEVRTRVARELEDRYRRERATLVGRLAELEGEVVAAAPLRATPSGRVTALSL